MSSAAVVISALRVKVNGYVSFLKVFFSLTELFEINNVKHQSLARAHKHTHAQARTHTQMILDVKTEIFLRQRYVIHTPQSRVSS